MINLKYVFIIVITLFVGIQNINSQNVGNDEYLFDGYVRGRCKAYAPRNEIEGNIVTQWNAFNKALYKGDYRGVEKHLYPDIGFFLKPSFPGLSDEEIRKKYMNAIFDYTVNLKKASDEEGIDFYHIIAGISPIVEEKGALLCAIKVTTEMYDTRVKSGERYSYDPELGETICVSFDKGKNWTFMDYMDLTPMILEKRFTQNTINSILGK